MGFGTGVDYRQSLWLPVSFCPKILKPNAFRHTISEGILNLLEGSDAIYGVIVTRHAADRMLERGGLNRKSIQRIANQVYSNGYPINENGQIVAAIGYSLDFYGFYAVIIGLILTLPYTAYMKITKKEHVYPLIPFLTTGYIIILIILTVQGQSISWLL